MIWKRCSSCKGPINLGQPYWTCNVTTCNARATNFVFCKVSCWDAHLPTMRHKGAWAVEQKAPMTPEPPTEQANRRVIPSVASPSQGRVPEEVLVVVSKLKAYIKAKADMNTSGDVLEMLSDIIRNHADLAIEHARNDGRKTVMARDFVRRTAE